MMQLDATFAGTPLKAYGTQIHWRQTMNYAAAVSDGNRAYFDDEREGGIIAPPLFSVAVTWPVLEHIGDYIDAESFPSDILLTQVHHTEHLRFHRPVVPGEFLNVRGAIAAILPHRAGTRVVIRFDALDTDDRPVFTEHVGAMMRGVACIGSGTGQASLPRVPSPAGSTHSLWEATVFIEPERPFLYDGCSDIVFPIHTSRKFARQVGLPDIILQGTATLAFAAREIVNREAAADPRRLSALACRFSGMVMPGTDIRIRLLEKQVCEDGTDLHFEVRNARGRRAISAGYAFVGHERPGDA